MNLAELADRGRLLTRPDRGDVDVGGVTADPGAVRAGDVFVVVGRTFGAARGDVAEAVRRGAVAVVADEGAAFPCPVPVLRAQDPRRALAFMAAGFAGRAVELRLCGVTGTNGKSSLLRLYAAAMDGAGTPTAVLETTHRAVGRGAVGARGSAALAEESARELALVADDGFRACGVELSSVALALGRAEGLRFSAGVFVSFSPDHLDFHRSTREQLEAQLELFRLLPATAAGVVNADDPAHELFAEETRARVVSYGLGGRADVRGEIRSAGLDGVDLDVRTPLGRARLRSPLVGRANASNLVGALAAAIASGADLEAAADALSAVKRLPGRMARVDGGGPVPVFVDYARNEAALEQALVAARGFARGRVIVVFGAAGDRPRGRRARMGRVADRHADVAFVTSDHPRSESPSEIVAAVVAGFSRHERVEIEIDRRVAIRRALAEAKDGDVVLVAGKGDETSMHVGDHLLRFEDEAEVRAALAERGVAG